MHWICNPIEKTPHGGSIIAEPAGVFSLEIRSAMALCICVRMQYISVHTIRLHLPTALNSSNWNTAPTYSFFFCNNTQHTNSCLLPGTLKSVSQMSDAPCPCCQSPFIGLSPRKKRTLVLRSEKKKLERWRKQDWSSQNEKHHKLVTTMTC